MIDSNRRRFLTGFAGLLAAPAIVRATSLMPVKAFFTIPERYVTVCDDRPASLLGYAQLKQEGQAVAFDYGFGTYPVAPGKKIFSGDLVLIGPDGYATACPVDSKNLYLKTNRHWQAGKASETVL